MSAPHDWQVTVGNIGTVYLGQSAAEARTAMRTYRAQAKTHGMRASYPVVLWRDDEPHEEYECACGCMDEGTLPIDVEP